MLILENLELDQNSKLLRISGVLVHLTKTEFLMLELLMLNVDKIVARSDVLSACDLFDGKGSKQLLNLHVSRLRIKLRESNEGGGLLFLYPRIWAFSKKSGKFQNRLRNCECSL